ncbi:MAG: glucose-1-phosphate thymidylyltransferase [Candidatus Cloacimonadota bacterium]|nr:MAG: glucose-1-phosphate thymidylyltransferase [Candidatus Cloacimonadota bacterium]
MFSPSELFKLENLSIKDIFDSVDQAHEILGDPLKEYCKQFKGREINGTVMEGATLVGDGIYIGEGSIVEPGAYIKGPAYIGKNTEIRHSAYLRGNVVVGDNCVVGHCTEVKMSIFLDGAKAGHFAYVGDSILGNDVNLGAGTKLANLKIIESDVMLHVDTGEKLVTGLRKMGAILGYGVEIGCNAVTSPGTILAPKSMVYPAIGIKGAFSKRVILRESNMVRK